MVKNISFNQCHLRVGLLALLLTVVCNPAYSGGGRSSCVTLENSGTAKQQLSPWSYNIAYSSDHKRIAMYQHLPKEKAAVFQAWDGRTGKLLAQTKAADYDELSSQTHLSFSPDNKLVYLEGMTAGIPFWNIDKNRLVFSACETAMGVSEVQFSDDSSIAYSTTVDAHQSLCMTESEEELLVMRYHHGDYVFDKQGKHLYADFAYASDDAYQKILVQTANGKQKQITHYQLPESLRNLSSRLSKKDSQHSAFIGTPPKHRVFALHTEADTLLYSLWDYGADGTKPKSIYERSLKTPELAFEGEPYLWDGSELLRSDDGQHIAFLSQSHVLVVFQVETGKIMWKVTLGAGRTKSGSKNFDLLQKLKLTIADKHHMVVERKEPRALIVFDWKTGKQKTIEIDEKFSSIGPKQYGKWGVSNIISPAGSTRLATETLLIIDFATGKQQEIIVPNDYHTHRGIWLKHRNEVIFEPIDNARKRNTNAAYSILVLNLETAKSRVVTSPLYDEGYYSIDHLRLSGHDHLLVRATKYGDDSIVEKSGIHLYALDNQKARSFDVANSVLSSELDQSGASSELLTLSYKRGEEKLQLCRFKLTALND